LKEEFFIKQFKNRYIGDDAAILDKEIFKSKNIVIASDSFFENIHFKREWFSLKELAVKASLVNLSDIIVMNAKPKFAILNVGFPKNLTLNEIKEFAEGFKETAKKYNYEIIGGDTIKNDKIAISMTFLGETSKPITRKAKINELVAYTGDLGSVKRDLDVLLRGGMVSKNSKFIRPVLRDKFFYKASKYITAACDISDGLFKELERISKISRLGYKFFRNIGYNEGCSGEEYEILFTFNPRHLKAIKKIAQNTGTKINIIAKTKRGKFISLCKENHF
jgi:thiamine-monophosphate kinase